MKSETKHFIIAVKDHEKLSAFIRRANKIICKWVNSHCSDEGEYLFSIKNIKREAVLKEPSKGLKMSNLAAYSWIYELTTGGLEEYESKYSDKGSGSEGKSKASGRAGKDQEMGKGKRREESANL